MAKQITMQNFEQEVVQSAAPILLDFWATWCGPCQRQGPIIDQMAADGWNVGKVNVDESQELAAKFRVMSIPTLVVVKDGKEVARAVGLQAREQLEQMLRNA